MGFQGDVYGKRAMDFVQSLNQMTGYDDIRRLVLREMAWFGLDYVTSFSIPGPDETFKDCMWLNNRPQDYIDRYSEQNYVLQDPVVTELRTNLTPYSWNDLRTTRNLSKMQRNIIDEAREWDSRDGMMIQIVTGAGSISCFCPCGREPDLSPRARAALELIAIYSHHALKRARLNRSRQKVAHTPLTPREREVLNWVAISKTDSEIGEILSISTETATRHVQNIKRKLNAAGRSYAVVQGLRCGEISL